MPVYFIYFIQILLVIHVLKTGRNRYWIWLLIMLPLVGGAAYVIMEILPEYTGGVGGQKAMRQVKKAINPGAELNHHAAAWEQSPNADNARRYARVLIDLEKFEQADEVLSTALSGFFNTDPSLLLLRAELEFRTGKTTDAVASLELLRSENPDFKSAEGHLLYARALDSAGQPERALEEYRAVATYFPGVEARYRMVKALQANGLEEQAKTELKQLLTDAKLAPAHFRKSQKKWLSLASEELKTLES